MKNNVLLMGFLLIFSFIACNNGQKRESQILKELEQGKINEDNFSKSFESKNLILESKNSEELTNIASNIYAHIGTPFYKQDTLRLNIAIEYLDRALELNSKNRSAYRNKVTILTSMQQWNKSLETINQWLSKGVPHYYDFMLKGFIFEELEINDSSLTSFGTALNIFEDMEIEKNDVNNLVQKAIIVSFLYGKDKGIEEINKLINETNSEYVIGVRENLIKNFEKKEFIKKEIFRRPEELKPSDGSTPDARSMSE